MHTYQLPSGNWRTIVQVDGRRRSATASTRKDSRSEAARMLLDLGATRPSRATVAQLLDLHLAQQPLSPGTLEAYERVRRLHLPDAFEALAVAAVRPPALDRLYRQLEAAGVAANPIIRLNALLSGAFKRAVRMGWTSANPCRDAALPAVAEPQTRTPETSEAKMLLAACDAISPAFGLFARVAAHTGARPGEVVGLQRHDVDIDEGAIRYVRGVVRVKGAWLAGPLKTGRKGRRRLAIGSGLAARLGAHLLGQDLEAMELGGTIDADGWLFTEDHRNPWYPSTPSRWWRQARRCVGIDDVRLYDLRHYVATELFAGGFDDQTAMRRLGHTNPAMASKRYATSRPARDRAAAEWLERELGG